MSIQTVSESVKDDVGASGSSEATRNSDDITSLAAGPKSGGEVRLS